MSDFQYLTALQEQVRKGQRHKYLCFWEHIPKQKTVIDKSCFSQWFPSKFEVDGVQYKNTEQYMMAQKAKLFGDDEILNKILRTADPKEIKVLGRLVKGYQESVWLEHRFNIVVQGNLAKFSQNEDLKQFLLNTGERVLVEASPVDKIWGIGLSAEDEKAEKPLQWKGLNLLGFALMEVRKQF
ncbi:NADAR family protein [Acinetobacter sichuanensis]|uniref:NADAR family protein n=1 Tax=Acinetobacter sichuanensis TaxID=2136183 RepID=A0A371YUE5_9GAMM|nr:NADAR family protein [Acinetobacter sichuanensis]RFC85085.1 NADAR family protein [Acinetobacter sichuanensis]